MIFVLDICEQASRALLHSQCELVSNAALLMLMLPLVLVGGFVLFNEAGKYDVDHVFI